MNTLPGVQRLRTAADALRQPGIRRSAAGTAVLDVCGTGLGAFTSLVIAGVLGATGRGEYAAIMAWFGLCLVVGEFGQTAATCFYAAREPDRAPDYVATSRGMVLVTGVVTLLIGWLIAPLLSHDKSELIWGYRIAFATCVVMYGGSAYLAGLQARSIARWNLVKVSKSVFFLVGIGALFVTDSMSLLMVLLAFAGAVLLYAALAHVTAAGTGLCGGRAKFELVPPLTRYGVSQVAALAPLAVNSRMDQIVLSQTVPAADLGRYAVAAGLTALAVPFVAAIGTVALPRLASRRAIPGGAARFQRLALIGSAAIAAVVLLPLAAAARWLIPLVLGADFDGSAILILLLAPGGIFLACGNVAGDLLRGRNCPMDVARAYGVGAVITVLLLFILLPLLGVLSAAISSSLGYAGSFAMMVRKLIQLPDDL